MPNPNAKIKTSCVVDGEVTLTPADLRIFYCTNEPSLSFYVFTCPHCEMLQKKPMTQEYWVNRLQEIGVFVKRWETITPETHDESLPLFTWDDCIDFHYQVETWDGQLTQVK